MYQCSEETAASILPFFSEDGASLFFWNTGSYLPVYSTSRTRITDA
jgi:hypothetical protein